MSAQSTERGPSLLRRGSRVLWRFISLHPAPFSAAVTGSVVYAAMSVAGANLLGRVTDRVITPAFAPHDHIHAHLQAHLRAGTVWFYAVAVVVVALVRGSGVVTRRYFAAMTARRSQVTLRGQVTDKYIDVPLAFHRAHPTGEGLQARRSAPAKKTAINSDSRGAWRAGPKKTAGAMWGARPEHTNLT